jgi:hypothetical protein
MIVEDATMFDWLHDALRSAAISRVLTRGIKAYREGDLPLARTSLDEVLAATEPGGAASQRQHRSSVRLIAVTLRAEVAAQQGDAAAARASIAEGFALWEEARRAPKIGPRSVEAFVSWERWARGWLERDAGRET